MRCTFCLCIGKIRVSSWPQGRDVTHPAERRQSSRPVRLEGVCSSALTGYLGLFSLRRSFLLNRRRCSRFFCSQESIRLSSSSPLPVQEMSSARSSTGFRVEVPKDFVTVGMSPVSGKNLDRARSGTAVTGGVVACQLAAHHRRPDHRGGGRTARTAADISATGPSPRSGVMLFWHL